jgi:hypothetical protein
MIRRLENQFVTAEVAPDVADRSVVYGLLSSTQKRVRLADITSGSSIFLRPGVPTAMFPKVFGPKPHGGVKQ